jgi:hypothetical protein
MRTCQSIANLNRLKLDVRIHFVPPLNPGIAWRRRDSSVSHDSVGRLHKTEARASPVFGAAAIAAGLGSSSLTSPISGLRMGWRKKKPRRCENPHSGATFSRSDTAHHEPRPQNHSISLSITRQASRQLFSFFSSLPAAESTNRSTGHLPAPTGALKMDIEIQLTPHGRLSDT